MICARAPFRVALAGGGTDLPAFYSKHGSTLLTCAIDKYIHVFIRKELLSTDLRLRYSENEIVLSASDLKHARARECLKYFEIQDSVEITSIADLPPGTGMGSSGSYLVALISALSEHIGSKLTKYEIAELACKLEMDVCKQPVGKQDQFIASFGGIKILKINTEGHVVVQEAELSSSTKNSLMKNCMIFYTGKQRDASKVLDDQQKFITQNDDPMMQIQKIGVESIDALQCGDVDAFGRLMHQHWIQKKRMSKNMSISNVDELYIDLYQQDMILGGKIIGAGGGGFLLVYTNSDHEVVENSIVRTGFRRLDWKFDEEGVSPINGI
jgi:D-glycero-alpha-D-manno-heptose-7-phosphate kinase